MLRAPHVADETCFTQGHIPHMPLERQGPFTTACERLLAEASEVVSHLQKTREHENPVPLGAEATPEYVNELDPGAFECPLRRLLYPMRVQGLPDFDDPVLDAEERAFDDHLLALSLSQASHAASHGSVRERDRELDPGALLSQNALGLRKIPDIVPRDHPKIVGKSVRPWKEGDIVPSTFPEEDDHDMRPVTEALASLPLPDVPVSWQSRATRTHEDAEMDISPPQPSEKDLRDARLLRECCLGDWSVILQAAERRKELHLMKERRADHLDNLAERLDQT